MKDKFTWLRNFNDTADKLQNDVNSMEVAYQKHISNEIADRREQEYSALAMMWQILHALPVSELTALLLNKEFKHKGARKLVASYAEIAEEYRKMHGISS